MYAGLVRRLTLIVGDGDEATDLAQDSYLRAFRAWGRFDGRNPRAWLYTIGIRLALNRLRHKRRVRETKLVDMPNAEDAEVSNQRIDLLEALMVLAPQERAVLLLSAVDGYTQAEIAGFLGVTPGRVGNWLAVSKSKMREIL